MDRQLVYIVLAVAILFFIGMVIKDWRFSSKKKENAVLRPAKSGLEITLPLCLQAYERLVVFLERIRPEALIHRLNQPQMNVQETRQLLIQAIRSEYEHNVSQQVYVSSAGWEAVESAKEQLVHFIHATAAELPPEENGNMLRKTLLQLSAAEKESPVSIALKVLNNESKKLLKEAKCS